MRDYTRLAILIVLIGALSIPAPAVALDGDNATNQIDEEQLVEGHTQPSNESVANSSREVSAVYFYTDSCPDCQRVDDYLDGIDNSRLNIVKRSAIPYSDEMVEYGEQYGVPEKKRTGVPIMYFEDDYALGSDDIISTIDTKLASNETSALPSLADEYESNPPGLLAIGVIAFSDAINPCALAILLILLTTLISRAGGRTNAVLSAGLAYTGTIFALYFAIGMLLIYGFKSVGSITGLAPAFMTQLVGVLAIALGAIYVSNYELKVPKSWRPKMQRQVTERLWRYNSVTLGAVIAGAVVSLFLLPCTAGPYVVAAGWLAGTTWSTAIPHLLVYNIIFVLPMLGITLAVYRGLPASTIDEWKNDYQDDFRLSMGVVLILLGLVVLFL
ncbi:cytochrome c biosis transmembrane protein [Halorhabdus tiamatea SARL4B]|uniref:Cytochrome c biosis transmembrane protein n=1 Tax=Halorhabdus tiamatea SARL4B TaxID=1033806 RepID=U2DP55_9EURY|nr:GAP family protein [Halorhabdus tiamatea]ERJ07422.1 cytochrome c biosis transmembrane protein [Halorhabdus tiamatea SARL4B]